MCFLLSSNLRTDKQDTLFPGNILEMSNHHIISFTYQIKIMWCCYERRCAHALSPLSYLHGSHVSYTRELEHHISQSSHSANSYARPPGVKKKRKKKVFLELLVLAVLINSQKLNN